MSVPLHRSIAVEGVGLGHKALAVLGLFGLTIEITPILPSGGGGSGLIEPIISLKQELPKDVNKFRVVIKYNNRLISDKTWTRKSVKALFGIKKMVDNMVKFKIWIENKVQFKVK